MLLYDFYSKLIVFKMFHFCYGIKKIKTNPEGYFSYLIVLNSLQKIKVLKNRFLLLTYFSKQKLL